MSRTIPVIPDEAARLRQEVERLTEARDALSGDYLACAAERDRAQTDLLVAETRIGELIEQRGTETLRADLWKDRAQALREVLVACGRILPTCQCGVSCCVRCAILRQRAEALGEESV